MRASILCVFCGVWLAACGGEGADPVAAPEAEATSGGVGEAGAEAGAEEEAEPGPIEAAVAGSHRSEENRARDRYRHPVETLKLFGLEPDMTVVEMLPGRGWYTEILAPVLREEGRLIAAIPDPEAEGYVGRIAREYRDEFLRSHPEVYDRVETVVFSPPDEVRLGPPESADMVVTFRSAHNWVRRTDPKVVFEAMAEVLEPGGILGFVQHRAPEGADPEEWAEKGYLPEAYVIELAEEAGLELVERSEINANPKDTKDHPEGVWSLPPSLREGPEPKYQEIGESDRMTLVFRKPASE
ncbi:MAG: class I SAM-dependent methyltransferase [Myxococcota bacterium]